ncbi:MAG: DUF2784 domain-containing protein [Acidobacteriota bacterium]
MYRLLDYFFFASHVCMIVFVLAGWAFRRTRKVHLILLLVIAFSWFGLGLCFGLGYCFWTDWHWQVREKLGLAATPASFVKLMIDSVTGANTDPGAVDALTCAVFFAALCLSLFVNLRPKAY